MSTPIRPPSIRLKDLDIRAIIDLLNHEDVQALLGTGDRALACAIHSHITRLHFHPHTCSREKPRSDLGWKSWPSILSQQPPLSRLTCLKFRSVKLKPNFACIPATLTRFSLNTVTFRVNSPDELEFALPNVTQLSLVQNGVYNPSDEKATFDVQWIINSVRKCPNITTLKYIPNFSNVEGYETVVQQCTATLSLLSKLQIARVSETMALHSLAIEKLVVGTTYRWGRLPSLSLGQVVMLPETLHSLKIGTCDDPTLLNLLHGVGAPCNLRRLKLTRLARGRLRKDVLIAISQFTRLESLELTDIPAGYDEPLHQSNDLSMLPRSLKRLSHWFATCPPQWTDLPPNVEFIQSSLRHLVTVPFDETIYSQRIPKTILSLALVDQTIKVPLSHLIVLKLVITNDIAARAMSLVPPPTVTTLSVSMSKSVQSSVITECLSSWSQLPNLQRFHMRVSQNNLASSMIIRWLSQLHPRLRSLSITDNDEDGYIKLSDIQDLDLGLEGCSLPTSLTSLNLSFKYFTLTLPRTLPTCLRELVLGFREIHLSPSSPDLDQWPSTLKKIIFGGNFFKTAKQSTVITRQLMVSAFKALQRRLGKNRCRKYRLALLDEKS